MPWVALEEMFDDVGGKALVTQQGDGCPIPGNIWVSLDRALSNMVYWKVSLLMVGVDSLQSFLPMQTIP